MKQELRNTLYNYEAAPPEDAWTKIVQELDERYSDPVPVPTPAPARVYTLRRWAAAAAVLIIVSGLAYWFNRISTSDNNSPVVTKNPTPSTGENTNKTEYITGTPVVDEEKEVEKPSFAGTGSIFKRDISDPEIIAQAIAVRPTHVDRPGALTADYNYSGISEAVQFVSHSDPATNLAPADSYVVYKNNKGELVRMSPKLAAFVLEDPEIRIVPGAGIVGSNRLKWMLSQWEEKINRSSFIPSAENFMDIISLIEMIEGQEK